MDDHRRRVERSSAPTRPGSRSVLNCIRVWRPRQRFSGDPMADHLVAMVRAERRHAAEQTARADGVLAAGRAAAGLAHQVQQAVLALIRRFRTGGLHPGELPPILGRGCGRICAEGDGPTLVRCRPAHRRAWFEAAALSAVRSEPPDAALVHAEAARLAVRDALVRVAWHGAPALLSLVSRDGRPLDQAQGAGALAFLGRAVGATLDRGHDREPRRGALSRLAREGASSFAADGGAYGADLAHFLGFLVRHLGAEPDAPRWRRCARRFSRLAGGSAWRA